MTVLTDTLSGLLSATGAACRPVPRRPPKGSHHAEPQPPRPERPAHVHRHSVLPLNPVRPAQHHPVGLTSRFHEVGRPRLDQISGECS